jgi:hypothetical protein
MASFESIIKNNSHKISAAIESDYRNLSANSKRTGKFYKRNTMPKISSAPNEMLQEQTGKAMRAFNADDQYKDNILTIDLGYRVPFANNGFNYAAYWERDVARNERRSGIRAYLQSYRFRKAFTNSLKSIFT